MAGFLGQDWSFGNLKGKTKGLLADGGQGLGALQGNPLFGAGMGLLSSSYDARVNPFQAAMGGLQSATEYGRTEEDREREQAYRDKMREFFEKMAGQGAGVPGAPTATEEALQMSLLPGMPGSSALPAPPTNAPGGGMQGSTFPQSRVSALQGLPGGDAYQQQMNRLAWEQIIRGQ